MHGRRIVVTMVVGIALSVCGLIEGKAQQFTMKLSTPTINDVVHEYYKAIKSGIERRSDGRIKVEIYVASQLGALPAVAEGLTLGTIEVASAAVGSWVGIDPRFQIFEAPGLFDSMRHGDRVLKDPEVRKRIASFGQSQDVEVISIAVYSPMMLLSRTPIRGVADFKSKKIRTLGGAPAIVEPLRGLGGLPVSLPTSEVLPALQNGTIDGLMAGTSLLAAFKYYDVAKPATYLPSTFLVSAVLINRRFLKSLGSELEAIVRDEARKAENLFSTWGIEDVARSEKVWRTNGGELIEMIPEESQRYLERTMPIVVRTLSSNKAMTADYETLLHSAEKHRN